MTYKQIQEAHEVRMWITTVVVPAILIVAAIDANHPDLKYKVKDAVKKPFKTLKNKFSKE